MIQTRTVTVTNSKRSLKNYNGGYLTYFKLLPIFKKQYKIIKNQMKVHQKLKMFVSLTLQFIFKPLLYIFHTVTFYDVEYVVNNGNKSDISFKKYSKDYTVYMFRIIPIFYWNYEEPTDKDIKKILE